MDLRPIGGNRVAIGFAGLVGGPLDAPGAKDEALAAPWGGYLDEETTVLAGRKRL